MSVKRNWQGKAGHAYFFTVHEILAVSDDHVLDAAFENDRVERALLTAPVPPPASPSVGDEYVDAVLGVLLVHLLGLEDELFDDGVVARNHTRRS